MDKNKQLDQLLNTYKVPPVSASFADRIIFAATLVQQKQSLWSWISRLFKEFKLPVPGYSITALLATGFLVGFLMYDNYYLIDGAYIDNIYADSGEIIDQILDEDEAFL